MDSSSSSGPETSRTCAWQPGRTAAIARSARTSASSSRSSIRTCTSGSRPSAGSSAAIRQPRWLARRTRRSRSSSAPSGPTATSTATSRWSRRAASTGTLPGATSCTPSATSSRPRSPGSARLATTGSWVWRPALPTRSIASSDPPAGSGIDGHPEIEMALVELFRTTGERRYLELAARFVEARGAGLLGVGRFGRAYWQDHARVRDAPTVAGHAVRQLYLDCGAVDVATELGDQQLLDAVMRRWRDMIATRMYLTGGLAAATATRRSATRTSCHPTAPTPRRARRSPASCSPGACSWRRATPIAPTSWNGRSTTACCPALSFDGTRFFYVNTLQRRTDRVDGDDTRRRSRAVVRLCLLPTRTSCAS